MKGNMVPLPSDIPMKGALCRHYKGDIYKVFELALHSNDDEWMVVYEPTYKNPDAQYFTRPEREWSELVEWKDENVVRFTLISDQGISP